MKLRIKLGLGVALCVAFLMTPNQQIIQAETPTITLGDFSSIYEASRQGVVTVYNFESNGVTDYTYVQGLGSGFVFAEDAQFDYILTNQHVVEGGLAFLILTSGYQQFQAQLVGADEGLDVAVLKVPKTEALKVLPMGNSDLVNVGEEVMAMGNPLSLTLKETSTVGLIAGIRRNFFTNGASLEDLTQMIQIEATVNPGNSGGPLFNALGQVIGINAMAYLKDNFGQQQETLDFSIPINIALLAARSIISTGTFVRVTMGVAEYRDITSFTFAEQALWHVPSGHISGVMIHPGTTSALYAAGINNYAYLISMDGVPITDVYELRTQLYQHHVGEEVTLHVLVYNATTQAHDEKTITLKLIAL